MKSIIDCIKDFFQHDNLHDRLVKMATIDKSVKLDKNFYRIAVHGASFKDREHPHIHIYLSNDASLKQFNIEISLIDLLCKDEINLIRMPDQTKKKKGNIKNRAFYSWDWYKGMEENFEGWLYSKPKKLTDAFKDNLDSVIYNYNQESEGENYLLKYMSDRNLRILKKYYSYFSKEDKENFPECFN